jgi:hypothetical protein
MIKNRNLDLSTRFTVVPENATYKTIVWTVKTAGGTGATINGNILTATAAGTANVTATIVNGKGVEDFTLDFNVIVSDAFVPVTGISGIPGTIFSQRPFNLDDHAVVDPQNATEQVITWKVESGSAGITIESGNSILFAREDGPIEILATIAGGLTEAGADYTKPFTIEAESMPNVFLTITFAQITDVNLPDVTGPTIYRNTGGTATRTAILTVEEDLYDEVNWYITGTDITGTGTSFTLDAANPAYYALGLHFLTVEVKTKDGRWYNKTVTFTVAW